MDISTKSTFELEYQLKLATDYGVLELPESDTLSAEVIDTRRMLCGLRKKVLAAEG